jgi:hypothetical protein
LVFEGAGHAFACDPAVFHKPSAETQAKTFDWLTSALG